MRIAPEHHIAALKIWNYNKNKTSLNIGVKLVEVLHNDVSITTSEVCIGSGDTYKDYSQLIKLNIPYALPTDRQQQKIETPKNMTQTQ